MLVCFSAENYRSIGEKVTLDLRANTRLRRLKSHVRKVPVEGSKKPLSILKSAAIYGANASGKSNLIKAVEHSRTFICDGPTSNGVQRNPFKFYDKSKPSSFYFEFIVSSIRIGYAYQVNDDQVLYEELITIDEEHDITVFSRVYDEETDTYIIDSSIDFSDSEESMKVWNEFETLADFCPENKLLITEINDKNAKVLEQKMGEFVYIFRMVYAFMKYSIVIIFPNTKYSALGRDILKDKYRNEYVQTLNSFDTGVSDLCIEKVSEGIFTKDFLDSMSNRLKSSGRNFLMFEHSGDEYYVSLDEKTQNIEYFSVISKHKDIKGQEISFSIREESDGTIRLLDLIPIIENDVRNDGSVFLIDEFDRSLHPNLAKSYFSLFMDKTKNNSDQLIVTTHQSELLDNKVLRRDEIWFAQKEKDQSSYVYTLDDFNTRPDMDIRYAYLNGKFGSIPFGK
ncbi:ATPase_AAA_core domain-containing protein [Vibrio chagasii]|nr:ATPase_AAA_core domain-containing protein [Vibrio chagasii]CAH7244257.1 ATPase_AAA_core domain-containing protein [Vibrio chagasii]CAH7433059.1 ATPase_AAA_core domain-containing protein [Vibrio chagasii]